MFDESEKQVFKTYFKQVHWMHSRYLGETMFEKSLTYQTSNNHKFVGDIN